MITPVSWPSLEERGDLLDGPVLGLRHDDLDVDDEDDLDHDEDDEDVGVHRQLQGREHYRVTHLLLDLGWVDLGSYPAWLMGRYCCYLPSRQDGGTG